MAFNKDAPIGTLEGQQLPSDALTVGTRQGNVKHVHPRATSESMKQARTKSKPPTTTFGSMKQGRG